jgi:hypothetical protein
VTLTGYEWLTTELISRHRRRALTDAIVQVSGARK